MRLTLVLPQLVWPEPEDKVALEKLSCPGLEWLQAHGRSERRPPESYENTLASLFGLGGKSPFGALRLLGEPSAHLQPNAHEHLWLCADPVHLRFHQGRFVLADATAFELSSDEAHALAASLNQEFVEVGQFHVAQSQRWYIRLNDNAGLPLPNLIEPLSAVAGRRIQTQLPSWLNEVQMFLHSHPVNEERAAVGKPAVNSLWLWGPGRLPQGVDSDYDGVWANDPLAIGLARTSNIPTHAVPAQLDSLLTHIAPDTTHLVVLDDLLAPALYENSKAWRDKLLQLDKNWFSTLRSALGRQVTEVKLLAPTAYGLLIWQLNGSDRWKFWRRPQDLATLARELAQ